MEFLHRYIDIFHLIFGIAIVINTSLQIYWFRYTLKKDKKKRKPSRAKRMLGQ